MRFNVNSFISLCLIGISIGVVMAALKWPFRTALFPMTIGISVLLMASLELILSLFEKEEADVKLRQRDPEDSEKIDPVLARQRRYNIFAWIIGFFLMVLFFGFPIAVPLLVFSYLKLQSKEGWVITLILTATTLIFFQGLFVWLLDTFFTEGWIINGLKMLLG